jgi:hypothetical protein
LQEDIELHCRRPKKLLFLEYFKHINLFLIVIIVDSWYLYESSNTS